MILATLLLCVLSLFLRDRVCKVDDALRLAFATIFFATLIFYVLLELTFHQRDAVFLRTTIAAVVLFFGLTYVFNLFGALNRGKQRRTVSEMRQINIVIRSQRLDSRHFSSFHNLQSLSTQQLPETDAWGNPYVAFSDSTGYTVISYGECGKPDVVDPTTYTHAATTEFASDIVLKNGAFLRLPEGIQ